MNSGVQIHYISNSSSHVNQPIYIAPKSLSRQHLKQCHPMTSVCKIYYIPSIFPRQSVPRYLTSLPAQTNDCTNLQDTCDCTNKCSTDHAACTTVSKCAQSTCIESYAASQVRVQCSLCIIYIYSINFPKFEDFHW